MSSALSPVEILKELQKIQNIPSEELKEMSINAKEYFENYVRGYFEDPTLSFIKWLKGDENDI